MKNLKSILGFCGACIAFYIGAGFATMQEVMQYEASYGSLFGVVILVAAVIYVYTNISFTNNGNRLGLTRGGDIYQAYCGKWIGLAFDYFSALFCYMSFVVMCGGANSTCMEQWGMPNGAGAVILAAAAIVTVVFGLNGVVKALKVVAPIIILLIIFVGCWTAITGWSNFSEGLAAVDSHKYEITQVGEGNPFASGASYGGFVILWFAAFLAEIGAKNSVKNVNRGMLLSTIAIFGVAAICCIALIGHIDTTWDADVPALVLTGSIHPVFGAIYAFIIFLGIYSSACPLLWTGISRIAENGTKKYKIWVIALGILGCVIACYVPYRPLLNMIYGLNGYLGFILVAFMIWNDVKVWMSNRQSGKELNMDALDIELRKHKFIAFVEDHYTPLGVVRSLGEANIPFDVILVNTERQYLVSSSKYVKKMIKFATYEEGLDYLVKTYSNEEYKPFVLTGCDNIANLMDAHYDELKDKFYFYNAGETGRLAWLQNKFNITSLGEDAGLDNPRREVVDTGVLPNTLRYPVITKVLMSIMGAWKGDVYVCNNEDELKEAYAKIKSPKLMVQEYVKKKGEFCMEGFSINKGQDVCLPYIVNYIRLTSTSYGDYMELSPFRDETLKKKILELLKKTQFEGIFEIEFMRGPNDEVYFLEINFRASTWNYALTAGGCNMPYLWAKSTLAGRILTEEMTLETQPFTAIVDIDEFLTSVVRLKKVSALKWFKEWKDCKAHYQYNSKDLAPFFGHLYHRTIKKLLKKFR